MASYVSKQYPLELQVRVMSANNVPLNCVLYVGKYNMERWAMGKYKIRGGVDISFEVTKNLFV